MRTKYTLSASSWTAISTAGQDGLVCVKDLKWNGRAIVDSSSSGTSSLSTEKGALVYVESALNHGLELDADDDDTIFYAIGLEDGVEIIADMC